MLIRRRNVRRREARGERWRLPELPWRRLGLIGAGVLAVLAGGLGLALLGNQPIEHIQVEGQFQHLTALDVERAVREQLHGAGLLGVKLDDVRRSLRMLPWVESATVQRSWPRGLVVQVTEQQAVARWNESDLVNVRGDRFASNTHFVPPELPQLSGPNGSAAEVVRRFLALQVGVVEAGLRLAALRLDARGAWELQLDNGVVVRIGRKQVDERCARFLAVALRMISQRAADIAYVDMRYTNGFAIGWRSGATRLATGGTSMKGKADG
ncbi:MAG TPA: cell division protein FtsQ/DivIB [Steroidobacteraceae bacterium]|nr:cell division protein FtsQ/DivIB [Steroidobacteraceae bacterium]